MNMCALLAGPRATLFFFQHSVKEKSCNWRMITRNFQDLASSTPNLHLRARYKSLISSASGLVINQNPNSMGPNYYFR
jgi:hypothetical protein